MSIDKVTLDKIDCNYQGNFSPGINKINLSECLKNITNNNPEITLISDKGVFSKKIFYNKNTIINNIENNLNNSNNTNNSQPVSTLCDNLTGGKWIEVPGDSSLGTSNFCVMKYEAKNVENSPNSNETGNPWTDITWQQAKTYCQSLGTGYHLLTDDEWITIARNIENVSTNWNSSIVGTGFVYTGHNDGYPGNSLSASINDSEGYFGTLDNETNCDGYYSNYPDNSYDNTYSLACLGQKRTLKLSNNFVIWDFSGNIGEYVDYSINSNSRYHGGNSGFMSYNFDDGTGLIATNVPASKKPYNSSWNSYFGMGRYYDGYNLLGSYNSISQSPDFCSGYCSPTATFLRSSYWSLGISSGLYTINLNAGPSYADQYSGFRCAYSE